MLLSDEASCKDPWWGTADEKIKASGQRLPLYKPGVGQNIALHAV